MFYVMCQKLTNGFIENGHNVFTYDDRLFARLSSPLRSRAFGSARMNKQLLLCCQNFNPDMIVLNFADLIELSTIEAAREMLPDVKVVNIFIDPLDSIRNQTRLIEYGRHCDASFITTAGQAQAEMATRVKNLYYIPNAVDRRVENLRVFEQTNQPHDIFYSVGSVRGAPDRVTQAIELSRWIPEARCSFYGFGGIAPIWGDDYFKAIAAARIGLNFSRQKDYYLYSSDRMAHYMGNGLLTVFDTGNGFQDLFNDDEVVFFAEISELADKIKFFLQNDHARQRVAKAGYQKIHAQHNAPTVTRYIVERAFDRPLSQTYDWPTHIPEVSAAKLQA